MVDEVHLGPSMGAARFNNRWEIVDLDNRIRQKSELGSRGLTRRSYLLGVR